MHNQQWRTTMRVTNTIALDDRDIRRRFVRAAGPGGRHVPRKATAVELRFDIGRSRLPADVKDRLTALAGRLVTDEDVLVIYSRIHRSQAGNRQAAWTRLGALLRRAAITPDERRPTRPRTEAREQRLGAKARRSAIKRSRRAPGLTGG
jgi:ribosome-associated protein